jgi:MerR family transcriptional regulator, light-induced transcriptional regulator
MNEFQKEAGNLAPEAEIYLNCLLKADRTMAAQVINQTLAKGCNVKDIYTLIFQASQHEVGRLWEINRINVAQEHYCTAATQAIMAQLYPYIFSSVKNGHRLVAACVNGEQHELGIRMVADFFEMSGWDTYYLGANMPVKSLLTAISQYQAELLCISATINFNVSATSDLITAVRNSADTARIKILVGGRPFIIAPNLWAKIGADGFASDAGSAVNMGLNLVK